MKVILHPTDFSENACKAFLTAVKFAGHTGAKLVVTHVFDIPTLIERPFVTAYHNLVEEEVLRYEKGIAKWTEKLLPADLKCEIEFVALNNSFLIQAINALAIEKKADLIVVGTKGSSKIKEIFLGSTTLELIQESPIPVLAVPPAGFAQNPAKIAYAADFHPKDVLALRQLTRFAEIFNAKIDVVHVPEESNKIKDFPEDYVSIINKEADHNNINFVTLPQGNVYQRLLEYSEANKIDALAMLEKGRGIFSRLIKQNRVLKIGSNSPLPIICFNAKFLV